MQKPQIPKEDVIKELIDKLKDVKTWTDLYTIGLEYCIDVISDSGGCVQTFDFYISRPCNRYENITKRAEFDFIPIVVDKTNPNPNQSLKYVGNQCSEFYYFDVYETEISLKSLDPNFEGMFYNQYTLKPLRVTVFIVNVFRETPGPDREYLVNMYLDVGDLTKVQDTRGSARVQYPNWMVRDMTHILKLEKELKILKDDIFKKRKWDEFEKGYDGWESVDDDIVERHVKSCMTKVVIREDKFY